LAIELGVNFLPPSILYVGDARLRGRIGHIYPLRRRIGHIYPKRDFEARGENGCENKAEN